MIEARECKLVKARKPRCTDCSGNLRSPTDSDRVTPPSYFLAALALAVMIWLAIVGSCLPEGYHCLNRYIFVILYRTMILIALQVCSIDDHHTHTMNPKSARARTSTDDRHELHRITPAEPQFFSMQCVRMQDLRSLAQTSD
ncbi:hypothetical protein TWF217_002868 [Orbilia oligospora]|nr:hypothetical protein TWF751_005358 [Orbilia oligospora]KAF3235779.1 hypothetical protein TWF217_002868 [Orbilia oligospora]KAF3258818.1 hypothetical protein TWF128_004607 [Orbilia oligospora]KAF3274494.1 hypothetical protein TWF132_003513 [Orbilia oligospora]